MDCILLSFNVLHIYYPKYLGHSLPLLKDHTHTHTFRMLAAVVKQEHQGLLK